MITYEISKYYVGTSWYVLLSCLYAQRNLTAHKAIAQFAFRALVNLSDSPILSSYLSEPAYLDFLVSYIIVCPAMLSFSIKFTYTCTAPSFRTC